MPVVEVDLADDAFEEVEAKLGPRVYSGRKLIPEWAEWERSDRLVIVEEMPSRRNYLHGVLLELDAGKQIATFPASRHVVPQLGLSVIAQPLGSTAPPDSVVHLDDGLVVAARAELPDGTPARRPWVVSHEHTEYLWVLGEDAQGRLHGGLWSDPRRDHVTLTEPLEMAPPTWFEDPDYVTRWREGLEVRSAIRVCEATLEHAQPDWPCARTRLERDGTARCVSRIDPDCEPPYPRQPAWSTFVDGSEIETPPGTWDVLVDSPLASRVLLSQPTTHGLRLALATPGRVEALPEVHGDSSFALHEHYPVVWPLDLQWEPATLSLLMDLDRREIYQLPPMRALSNGVGLGLRRFLAREDAVDGRLLFVDLDGPRVDVAADVSDCDDGVLEPFVRRGTRLAVGCLAREGGRLRWSMVVDGAEGWVVRTRYRVEEVLPDGRILVSNRRGPGEAFATWFAWLEPQSRKSHIPRSQ